MELLANDSDLFRHHSQHALDPVRHWTGSWIGGGSVHYGFKWQEIDAFIS